MNVTNIASLLATLQRIGLPETVGRKLMMHLCFRPEAFKFTHRFPREKDVLICEFLIRRKGEAYALDYYDAYLLKLAELPAHPIHSININELEQQMADVEWDIQEDEEGIFRLEDESSWKREKDIEDIVMKLATLSASEEGQYFADALRVKYWSHSSMQPFVGNLTALRSKFEISQRFYVLGEQSISAEEAFRFLLNRWLEKQHQLQKKQASSLSENGAKGEALPVKKKSSKKASK